MTPIPVIAGAEHELHRPDVEIQGGRRLPAFDRPERIDAIVAELQRRGGCSFEAVQPHGDEPVLALHDAAMVEFVRAASEAAGEAPDGLLFADTFRHAALGAERDGAGPPPGAELGAHFGRFCFDTITAIAPGTYAAAQAAIDCAVTGAERLGRGSSLVLALARPAGHHAARSLLGGGTYFNNAAAAVERLRAQGYGRVALIDVDIHHGNGSQALFYERADVFFASVHVDPAQDFPYFVGFPDERGAGEGEGHNLNVVVDRGAGIEDYLRALASAVEALAAFGADALVVSLGVDGHRADPNDAAALATEDFRRIGAMLGELDLQTLLVLEGGYALDDVGASVAEWLEGYAG